MLQHPRNYLAHLVRDPATCGGETIFRGTRILLRAVLADLADGAATQDILRDFPCRLLATGRGAERRGPGVARVR